MMYIGVCEDNRNDPLKLGRIKVRVFGIHTEIRTGEVDNKIIPVKDLPWAVPCYPHGESIDGDSNFSVPNQGSVVLVTFLDEDKQNPIYFGTVPKIVKEMPNFSLGFSDPLKEFPTTEYINESPISRLARNENIDKTIIKEKKDSVKIGVDCKEQTWDEPETKYNTEYPFNNVIETKSGHFMEFDDTEGVERIHVYHRSGSNVEYHPDGTLVDKVVNKRFTITFSDNDILVEGNQNIHISGSKNIHIEGSENILIDGDRDKDVIGNEIDDIQGNMSITVLGNTDISTTGNTSISTSGNTDISTTGQTGVYSGAKVIIQGSTVEIN